LDTAGEETGGIPVDSDLRKLNNVYLTPGIAGPSGERRSWLFYVVVEDIRLFFMGKEPRNRVRGEMLPRLA
jgi:phosphoglycerate dehydrogenase-like enzyme